MQFVSSLLLFDESVALPPEPESVPLVLECLLVDSEVVVCVHVEYEPVDLFGGLDGRVVQGLEQLVAQVLHLQSTPEWHGDDVGAGECPGESGFQVDRPVLDQSLEVLLVTDQLQHSQSALVVLEPVVDDGGMAVATPVVQVLSEHAAPFAEEGLFGQGGLDALGVVPVVAVVAPHHLLVVYQLAAETELFGRGVGCAGHFDQWTGDSGRVY